MVTKVSKRLIRRNMEVYIDNMLVKSLSFEQHLKDLEEVFTMLKKYR